MNHNTVGKVKKHSKHLRVRGCMSIKCENCGHENEGTITFQSNKRQKLADTITENSSNLIENIKSHVQEIDLNEIKDGSHKRKTSRKGAKDKVKIPSSGTDLLSKSSLNDDDALCNIILSHKSLPIAVKIEHNGFWITEKGIHVSTDDVLCDRNSIMLKPSCSLYVLKLAMRHFLLSQRYITPNDVDAQNLVPHIQVRKNKSDTNSHYDHITDRSYIIKEEDLSEKTDFLTIELERERDLHFTVVFSKKIKSRVSTKEVFKLIVQVLNAKPSMIQEYSNLLYFGASLTHYWYENPNSWPTQINPPNYVAPVTNDSQISISNLTTTQIGSIVS